MGRRERQGDRGNARRVGLGYHAGPARSAVGERAGRSSEQNSRAIGRASGLAGSQRDGKR